MARLSFAPLRTCRNAFLVALGCSMGAPTAFANEPAHRSSTTVTTLSNTAIVAAATARENTRPVAASEAPLSTFGTKLAWRAGRTPQLLSTGFRARPDGAGEVVLQTSSEVVLESRLTKDGPVFVLKGCRTVRRTDRLALETRYFDSPITRVSLKQRAGDLEVAISLRQPAEVEPRKLTGPSGSWFWVLEFIAPRDTPTTTAAVTPPP